jgi:glycosyltransferase involved in cell wall biosynthesis
MKPFISICTPTYNRRPFISYLKKCILKQDYPLSCVEWIIIDDGVDKIKDLINDLSFVVYLPYNEVLSLGKKRNIMNKESKGEFIIYMDDDDYYPPDRISHAVEVLQNNPTYLIAGSSEMHCYFSDLDKLYQFGPYKENHATAATFIFRKELLQQTSFSEDAMLAEEKDFLKDYTIPLIQLNTTKTILVLAHIHNTFDKKKLLKNNNLGVKESTYSLNNFIKDKKLKNFYTKELNSVLEKYPLGNIKFKPDVLKQINELLESRNEHMQQMYQNYINQMGQKLQMMEQLIEEKDKKLQEKDRLIQELFKQNKTLKEKLI